MKYEVIETGQEIKHAKKALIALHGRGGTAEDILAFAKELCHTEFYLAAPQAPNNSWYPYSFLKEEAMNEPWLSTSIENVFSLIDQIALHIPKNKIYLIGFSQGACMALETASRNATKYGGVIAFSGGLIGESIDKNKYHGNFERTKVFIGNSDKDAHIPEARSKESKEILEKLGAHVTYKVYPGMSHTINKDEIMIAKQILNEEDL